MLVMRDCNSNARISGYTSKLGRRLSLTEQEKQSCCVSGEAQCCLELDDSKSSTPGYHHIRDIFWTTWNAQILITFPVTRHLPQAGLHKKSYSRSRQISASLREAGFYLTEGLDRLRREMVKKEQLPHHLERKVIHRKQIPAFESHISKEPTWRSEDHNLKVEHLKTFKAKCRRKRR